MVMKRYPHGAAGEFFFMKRAPTPAAAVDCDLLDRARLRRRDRLPDDPGPRRAAVGDQPRVHRPQPVVRAGATMSTARTTCTSTSTRARASRSTACGTTALVVHEALDVLKMPSVVKTTGSKGLHVYVPIRRGPTQKDVWTFAKALAQELALAASRADDDRVPRGEASGRPRARGLQPERVGTHARVGLFGAARGPRPPCRRRSRGRRSSGAFASRTSPSRTCRRASRGWETCGSRCLLSRGRFDLARYDLG